MFKELANFAEAFPLKMTISAAKGGGMQVVIVPTPPKDVSDESAKDALAQPILLSGTAEELDEGFLAALDTIAVSRKSLSEQVAAAALIMEQARKTVASKASKPAPTTPAASASTSNADDKDELPENETAPPAAKSESGATSARVPATTEIDLF